MKMMKNKKVILIVLVIVGLMMIQTREGHSNRKAHDKAHKNLITKEEFDKLDYKINANYANFKKFRSEMIN